MNLSNLKNLLNQSKISYVDVGASKNILERWKKYRKFLHVYAFEPIYEEYINLKSKKALRSEDSNSLHKPNQFNNSSRIISFPNKDKSNV